MRSERGQTAVEYAGLLTMLALVFGVLYAVGLPQKLGDAVATAVCSLEGRSDCGSAGSRQARTRLARRIDPDGDGLSNRQERRLGTSIRDSDTDGDGIPDGVEFRRKLDPRSRDTDRDGIQDAREVQLRPHTHEVAADPTKADTDGDGLLDGAELAAGTGIGQADGDDGFDYTGDGLSDYDEVMRYGTDPTRTDTDGDGTDDGKEVEAGTNPLVDERTLGDKLGPEVAGILLDDPFGLGKGGALKKLGKGLEKLGAKVGIKFGKKAEEAITETADNVAAARRRREAARKAAPAESVDEAALLKRVPPYEGGKTSGVLDTGSKQVDLVSGYKGPSSTMPKGTPGMNNRIKSHVEAHAAAVMRNEHVKEATLAINRVPCPGKTGCDAMLERMLPEGSRLTVVGPNGFRHTYVGRPDPK